MWLLKEILRKELPKHLSNKGAFPARGISGLKADASGIGWTTACLKSMSPYAIKASLSDRQ
jgi:hypothetical protein